MACNSIPDLIRAKQEKRALDDAIANYSELYDEMADTPWARFFDDADPEHEIDAI